MRVITEFDGFQYLWEPSTALVCAGCHGRVDITTLHANSLECVNFSWPDEEALQNGEYVYFHKRCTDRHGNFSTYLLMFDVKSVLGKDHYFFDAHKYMKKMLPVETWDTLCSQWLPQRRPKLSTAFKERSLALRYRIFKRDNYRCRICGVSIKDGKHVKLEIDHITPRSKGGTNDESNLWTLCFPCNRGKRNQLL